MQRGLRCHVLSEEGQLCVTVSKSQIMEVIHRATSFIESILVLHGWKLVGLVLVIALSKHEVLAFVARAQQKRSLAEANNPNRVSILEKERRRVREAQQLRTKQEAAQTKERIAKEKSERLLHDQHKKIIPPTSNPLDGSGGGQSTYRAVKRVVASGGGGG
jgi:hypothetical protein